MVGNNMVPGRYATAFVVAAALTIALQGIVQSPRPATAAAEAPAPEPAATPRTVIAEVYTGTWCFFCYFSGEALRVLEPQYSRDQLAIIEWHYSDAYEPVDGSITDRMNVYNIQAFPTLVVDGDGANKYEGGSDNASMIQAYKSMLDSALPKASPVEISQSVALSGSSVSVKVDAKATASLKSKLVVVVVAVVENLAVFDQGHWVGWVGRSMPLKKQVDLSSPQSVSATATLHASWDPAKTAIVSYVQDSVDNLILQGKWTAVGGGGGGGNDTQPPQISSVSHSPAAPNDLDIVTVSANIADNTFVKTSDLVYDDGSGPKTAAMTPSSGAYSAKVGPFAAGKTVAYHVEASDTAGNKAASPPASFLVSASSKKDTMPPSVAAPTVVPVDPDDTQTVTISAKITDDVAVASGSIEYVVGGGATQTSPMTAAGDSYSAIIGPFPAAAAVSAVVAGTDTSGNIGRSAPVTFTVKASPPNTDVALAAGGIALSEPEPIVGQQLTVEVTVKNDGPGEASSVALRLFDGGAKIGEVTIPTVASGGESTATFGWKPVVAGKRTLTAFVDPDRKLKDPDRANNKASLLVDVKPKSGPGGGVAPSSPSSGIDPGSLVTAGAVAALAVGGLAAGVWFAGRRGRERRRSERFFEEPWREDRR